MFSYVQNIRVKYSHSHAATVNTTKTERGKEVPGPFHGHDQQAYVTVVVPVLHCVRQCAITAEGGEGLKHIQ